jgi:hypothetical protein
MALATLCGRSLRGIDVVDVAGYKEQSPLQSIIDVQIIMIVASP